MTTWAPMLSRNITPIELQSVIARQGWWIDEKCDGHRRPTMVRDGRVSACNRNGEPSRLPAAVAAEFRRIGKDVHVDAELVDDTLHVFDLISLDAVSAERLPLSKRRALLERLFRAWTPAACVQLLPVARSRAKKVALVERLRSESHEGFVAKRADGLYVARNGPDDKTRSSTWLKMKFTFTVDCVVQSLGTEKANMQVGVYDGDVLVEIGEVSALTGDGPEIGRRYLAASLLRLMQPAVEIPRQVAVVTFLNSGTPDAPRLYQPVRPVLRHSKTPAQCTIDQLDGCWREDGVLRR